ncbi:MAG TPA: YlxR family protein [Thermomicrobiales bacterium]|jgi:hypothetical protein|nr:YlxR family protein [Thermomicrobiales bacterium]
MERETEPDQTREYQGDSTAIIVDRPRLGPQPSRPEPSRQQPRRPKHVPQRTCVACRDKDAKRTLTRLVRTPEGEVQIDPSGKRNGRGAYLCTQRTCWDKALATPVLSRALKIEIDQAAREAMIKHMATLPEQSGTTARNR